MKLLIIFIGLVCFSGISQNNEIRADRFYKTVDSILACKKPYNFNDTILFIQKSLESYVNNQVSDNFDSFFKCHEPKYQNKLTGDDLPTIAITSMYARIDKKYILLFYIENYLLENILKKNSIPDDINVYSAFGLKNIKTGKVMIIGKENKQETLQKLYKKLIDIYNNKAKLKELLYIKKISPLEYLGYKWEYHM